MRPYARPLRADRRGGAPTSPGPTHQPRPAQRRSPRPPCTRAQVSLTSAEFLPDFEPLRRGAQCTAEKHSLGSGLASAKACSAKCKAATSPKCSFFVRRPRRPAGRTPRPVEPRLRPQMFGTGANHGKCWGSATQTRWCTEGFSGGEWDFYARQPPRHEPQ